MAGYRKLGRTSAQRKALIRNQVTALLFNGKIVTTEAKAKEIRKVADGLIALAVKEKDNFENVTVTVKVARKDKDGKRVKEVVDGKKKTVYDSVEKTIKKDLPSRVHARREIQRQLMSQISYLTKLHLSMLDVTVVTQESLRLVSVKVMQLWKFFLS